MKQDNSSQNIKVTGAREKNLKRVSVAVPKKKITVFTGVSGSGKSALVFDTIAAESQRQLNETYSSFIRHRLPHYGQPNADSIENLSVAIIINQKRIGGNSRSTVGTITDIYSLLRLLFSRIGKPQVGEAEMFSFNNPQGMCPKCEGLGYVNEIDIDKLVDREKSLNEGAVQFPTFRPGEFRWKRYVCTGLFDNDKKLKDYTEDEWNTLLYKSGFKPPHPTEGWPGTSKYEGILPRIRRSFLSKESRDSEQYKNEIYNVTVSGTCPTCQGARLNRNVLECRINGKNIADCSALQVSDLIHVMLSVKDSVSATIIEEIVLRLNQLMSIGLGYLTLNRETASLSGGESQRIKMVRQLGSSLTDLTYIFDEPSIGLHPHDVNKINTLLKQLRDKGNTVIIVEHDPDVIRIADHLIDMGPKAGTSGGKVVYEGNLKGLLTANTLTGEFLNYHPELKQEPRRPSGWLTIQHVSMHNLNDVSVQIPLGVMTVVAGVAGSGKSSLVNHVLPKYIPEAVYINQEAVHATNRSNIATFCGIFDTIRNLFAKQNQVHASLFSFNSKGACPECKGTGIVSTDLAFMDSIETVCGTCEGRRFNNEVLRFTFRGQNISDVLRMTVEEASDYFQEQEILSVLARLQDVGIGYLTLGQPLGTLSGGELQRLKLAKEMEHRKEVYVLDEPTTGLHMSDVEQLIGILDRLVDQGSTVLVIEHNLDVMTQADWMIDLGPGAGQDGGKIIFEGLPNDIVNCKKSLTGLYLRKHLGRERE
ncbi:thiamine ABC transporter permease [Paenibacillus sp. J23TS9]|uniref:ATP-binding cassette domain-containing protein n=1 Tax=Paenibacillus sp. J23TS9 TaxID=2807193 RepID=UPI001B24BA88|nr:excinuclease ABC subunit UvrA [Paenibacillus sp. J23TS9]GIP25770.1 thiamine ABC transporter permease [Paenibacillus sp. J23TS9]